MNRFAYLILMLLAFPCDLVASEPVLLETGEVRFDGQSRPLAGIEPDGEAWLDRWREALLHAKWEVDLDGNEWRLTSGNLNLSKVLLAMGAAKVTEGAPEDLRRFQQTVGRQQLDSSRIAFRLDGNLYAPAAAANYLLADELVLVFSGQSLFCASQGNSAGYLVAPLTMIIDGRLIPLDGRPGVNALAYDSAEGILNVKSAHADMRCGVPIDARMTMHAPRNSAPSTSTQWKVQTTNHSQNSLQGLEFTAAWVPGASLTVSANCTRNGATAACSGPVLAPGQSWIETIYVTVPAGEVSGSCQGSMASAGRLSDEGCFADSAISAPVIINANRQGPAQASLHTPFVWEITLVNEGWDVAQGVTITDSTVPGSGMEFVEALEGAACASNQSTSGTTVSCQLDEDLEPGEERTIELRMQANQIGQYDVQCHVTWVGGQTSTPTECQDTIDIGDVLFRSRFEID